MSRHPLLDPEGQHVAHRNVAVLTLSSAEELDRLLEQETIRGLVWKRLDGCNAVVDATRTRALLRRLRELGVPARVGEPGAVP